MIILIAAIAKNGVIGSKRFLPWHFKSDMKNFKKITMGATIVFGRKTYESISNPLEGRKIIVLTRNNSFFTPKAIIKHSPYDILETYLKSKDKCFIGGGQQIFDFFIDYAEKIYLTEIEKYYEGDAFFPVNKLTDFKEVSNKEIIEKNILLKFKIFKRI